MTPAELPEDLLSAYLDGELDAPTRAAVEERLDGSALWRATLAEVRAARDALRALPPVDLTPQAWERVLTAVAADEPAPAPKTERVRALGRRVREWPLPWVGAAAVATAAAVVVAAVVLPAQQRVTPKVATFSTEQSARASVVGDPVSTLAGVGVMRGIGR